MNIKVNDSGFVYDADGQIWLPPINPKQFEIYTAAERYVLVHGPRKSSKCVSGDSIVRTDGGLCRMRRLVPFGEDGQSVPVARSVIAANVSTGLLHPATVTESWKEPSRAAKRVACYRGYSVTCSPWHPLWVKVGAWSGWMTSTEIQIAIADGKKVWTPIANRHEHWNGQAPVVLKFLPHGPRVAKDARDFATLAASSVAATNKSLHSISSSTGLTWRRVRQWSNGELQDPLISEPLDEDMAYFLGLMVGDGCCTPSIVSNHALGFFDGDGHLSSWMRDFLKTRFPASSFYEPQPRGYRIGGAEIIGLISHLGLCKHAHEKTIPDAIIESPKSVVRSFLRGLFDTDGTADKKGRVSFCSSSSKLAEDVQRLLLEFGVESRMRFFRNDHKGAWIVYVVDSRLFYDEIGFGLERKQQRRNGIPKRWKSRYMKPGEPDGFGMRWQQIESVTDASSELYDVTVPGPHNFIANGLVNHNTWGVEHKVIRHAFDVNGAVVAIVTKTLKNAKSSGVWSLLCRLLPLWVAQCPGFSIVEGPKTTGDTKMSFVKIRNRHGGTSEIQCHSLEHATEVEDKFKGTAYSMFWLSELDQFCTEDAFNILCDALRAPGVPYDDHQIVADCNPPETGDQNWIHDLWFKFCDADPNGDEDDDFKRSQLRRILVMIDDNLQLDPREKKDLISRYKKRKGLYDRFILGKWTLDVTDGHFSDVWDETVHIVGKAEGPDLNAWDVMVPTPACTSLLTGWDMGTKKNHAFHVLEKVVHDFEFQDPDTGKLRHQMLISFSVLDEFVIVNKYMSIDEFVRECLTKIRHWNSYMQKRSGVNVKWRHWSDTSAFEQRASADKTEAAIAYEASGGLLILEGAPKYRNSRRDRVDIVWQLLHAQRLHVSAQLTFTRNMFINLKQGKKETEFIKPGPHVHPFDSLSYPIIAEAPMDMFRSTDPKTETGKVSGGLVVSSF